MAKERLRVMSLTDTARNIALLAKKGRSVELLEELMKLRDQATALQKENAQLKARVAELESRIARLDRRGARRS